MKLAVSRTAKLRNWDFAPHPMTGRWQAVGHIYDDERFENGEQVKTSSIVGVVTSNGTYYELE